MLGKYNVHEKTSQLSLVVINQPTIHIVIIILCSECVCMHNVANNMTHKTNYVYITFAKMYIANCMKMC